MPRVGCSGSLAGCGAELPAGKAMCCVCEQGSQPSTASPFKQDVFVYSASPGSESPGVGASATPVIMSRSPTGGSQPHRLGCHSWGTPGLLSAALGWGLWL